MGWNVICLILAVSFSASASEVQQVTSPGRSFLIGYNENCFLKDGQCFRYVSGSMHYFRVPTAYWKDRMLKMKAAGLNALQTYIEWRSHEPVPGTFVFTDNLDIVQYIKTAQEVGLLVVLRPGPFIDAERDMGGLPSWLLKMNNTMVLRTNDPTYMFYVERFFTKLTALLRPLTYANGGPIISFQVENEYGSYFACDRDYTARLRYVLEQGLGPDALLFTTDGAGDSYVQCGEVDGAYTTVDFGSGGNVTAAFQPQRKREPKGPLVNSEFYPGWLDHWGQPHALVDTSQVAKTLDEILAMNASVNIYMFHGGTSFGYTAGANTDGANIDFCPTSYDYDAPLSEAGDLTDKYMKLRAVIGKYLPLPPGPLPTNSTKIAFGPFQLQRKYGVLPLTNQNKPISSKYPLTFEELGLDYGFVYYETVVNFMVRDPVLLNIPGLRDRGYVYIDKVFQGILSRGDGIFTLPVMIRPGQNLSILVENQGRICFGPYINDFKGIMGNVTLGHQVLADWNMWPMTFVADRDYPNTIRIDLQEPKDKDSGNSYPAVYLTEFVLPTGLTPSDTFLKLDGWYKGMVGINNFNLGRYWPIVGPQETLYVPGSILKPNPAKNTMIILELENAPSGCNVTFVKDPSINTKTPADDRYAFLIDDSKDGDDLLLTEE